MGVILLMEWELPKDEEKIKKICELTEKWSAHFEKIASEKGIKAVYGSVATDNTGYFAEWWEVESLEDIQKVWDDEVYQRYWAQFAMLAENCRNRILRPYIKGLELKT